MDYIERYLERLFAKLPQTAELAAEKARMLQAARTEYQELRAGGMNEAAAVSQILDEFSSIDDLATQYISQQQRTFGQTTFYTDDQNPVLDGQMAADYLKAGRSAAFFKALGTGCMIWAFSFGAMAEFFKDLLTGVWGKFLADGIEIALAFLFIAAMVLGIILLIRSKKKETAFDFLKQGCYISPSGHQELDRFLQGGFNFQSSLIIGILLCVLAAPVSILCIIFMPVEMVEIASVILFMMIGAGVFILVYRSVVNKLAVQCRKFLMCSVRRNEQKLY